MCVLQRQAVRQLALTPRVRPARDADDTMQYVSAPVKTLCMGQASSMASLLLSAGAPGERRILPNARVMLHQPSGGAGGQASDIAIQAAEILKGARRVGSPCSPAAQASLLTWRRDAHDAVRARLNGLYVEHTGQPLARIESTLERDHFMSAEEAVAFGIVDEVVRRRPRAPAPAA